MRRLLLPLAVAATLAAAVAAHAASTKETFALKGEVYGNATMKIEMKNAANRRLTTIKAGTYRMKVEDRATVHNFHLVGPGVNKRTSLGGTTETVWTVRLRPGKYTFLCDPHASVMRGSFRVTAA